MATYYVRPDGNDSNTGLGSTTVLAWRTIQKALSASGIGSGDIVYIAPGHYNETVTVGGTYSAETQIIGDPTASQFVGVNAGFVKHSQFASSGTAARTITHLISSSGKSYLHFKNIYFEMAADNSTVSINITTGRFTKFTSCVFYNNLKTATPGTSYEFGTTTAGQTADLAISNCIFYGLKYGTLRSGTSTGDTSSIKNTVFIGCFVEAITTFNVGLSIYNCAFHLCDVGLRISSGVISVYNSLFNQCTTGIQNSGTLTENYNRFVGNVVNISGTYTPGGNTSSTGISGVESGYSLLHNLTNAVMFGSVQGSQNTSFGTTSGAPVSDLFGVTWSGTSPDAGAITFRSIGAVGTYLPTERNASTITIAPGSTSQSIELYLGATGLAFNTSGLKAYFVRNRSAPVEITLVAATTSTWVSGGFAEISAEFTPGVYRLDVPDAAFAAGSSDVTIVVRGASGTNGAVLTVTLSSGGLTEAQTASAVWSASPGPYVDATTMGGILTETNGLANGIDQEVGEIPILVWDEQLSSHTTAGTTGQRLNANVLADELLARDIGSGSSAGSINERTVRSALRGLRNKTTVINSEMTVYKEDDASTAWSATVSSSDSSKTITGVDPS